MAEVIDTRSMAHHQISGLGIKLRPVQTIDKSSPVLSANGDPALRVVRAEGGAPHPAGPPPPPPPQALHSGAIGNANDRGALLREIQGGKALRRTATVDKSLATGAGRVVGDTELPKPLSISPPDSSTSPTISPAPTPVPPDPLQRELTELLQSKARKGSLKEKLYDVPRVEKKQEEPPSPPEEAPVAKPVVQVQPVKKVSKLQENQTQVGHYDVPRITSTNRAEPEKVTPHTETPKVTKPSETPKVTVHAQPANVKTHTETSKVTSQAEPPKMVLNTIKAEPPLVKKSYPDTVTTRDEAQSRGSILPLTKPPPAPVSPAGKKSPTPARQKVAPPRKLHIIDREGGYSSDTAVQPQKGSLIRTQLQGYGATEAKVPFSQKIQAISRSRDALDDSESETDPPSQPHSLGYGRTGSIDYLDKGVRKVSSPFLEHRDIVLPEREVVPTISPPTVRRGGVALRVAAFNRRSSKPEAAPEVKIDVAADLAKCRAGSDPSHLKNRDTHESKSLTALKNQDTHRSKSPTARVDCNAGFTANQPHRAVVAAVKPTPMSPVAVTTTLQLEGQRERQVPVSMPWRVTKADIANANPNPAGTRAVCVELERQIERRLKGETSEAGQVLERERVNVRVSADTANELLQVVPNFNDLIGRFHEYKFEIDPDDPDSTLQFRLRDGQ